MCGTIKKTAAKIPFALPHQHRSCIENSNVSLSISQDYYYIPLQKNLFARKSLPLIHLYLHFTQISKMKFLYLSWQSLMQNFLMFFVDIDFGTWVNWCWLHSFVLFQFFEYSKNWKISFRIFQNFEKSSSNFRILLLLKHK